MRTNSIYLLMDFDLTHPTDFFGTQAGRNPD